MPNSEAIRYAKAQKAKNLRYKKGIVCGFNLMDIQNELYEIGSECDDVRYFYDGDEDTLLDALDGDGDDAYEFKMQFCDLSAKCEIIQELLNNGYVNEHFDDFFAAANKNGNMKMIGYDSYEEDYYSLMGFESRFAEEEAGKRLLQLTKAELIDTAAQCFGIAVAFMDIQAKYDRLKAAMDILRNKNASLLAAVKDIDKAYEAANEVDFYWSDPAVKTFNDLIAALPDKTWLE